MGIAFEIGDVILENLPNAEKYIYQLLSNLSGMTVKELEDMNPEMFLTMIMDVVKQSGFADFFKVAFEIYRVGDLEFWDLLFKRYASPFLLMDEMIATDRLVEFVDSIVKRTNKDNEESTLWEFFFEQDTGRILCGVC